MIYYELNKHVTDAVMHTETSLRNRLEALKVCTGPHPFVAASAANLTPKTPFETQHSLFVSTLPRYYNGPVRQALETGASGSDTKQGGLHGCPVCHGKCKLLIENQFMTCWQCGGVGAVRQ